MEKEIPEVKQYVLDRIRLGHSKIFIGRLETKCANDELFEPFRSIYIEHDDDGGFARMDTRGDLPTPEQAAELVKLFSQFL